MFRQSICQLSREDCSKLTFPVTSPEKGMLVELAEVQSVANPIECSMIPSESKCRGLLRILSAKANFAAGFTFGAFSANGIRECIAIYFAKDTAHRVM